MAKNWGVIPLFACVHILPIFHCKNAMHHGSRCRTTTAMLPHPWLWGIETLANVLCNKAT